jgi:hypothetical protein
LWLALGGPVAPTLGFDATPKAPKSEETFDDQRYCVEQAEQLSQPLDAKKRVASFFVCVVSILIPAAAYACVLSERTLVSHLWETTASAS